MFYAVWSMFLEKHNAQKAITLNVFRADASYQVNI